MFRSTIIIAIVAFQAIFAAGEAEAVRISQNGNVVFEDDFEAGTVGEPFGPVPGQPSWSFNVNGTSSALVTNSATPGVNQGTKYGEISRPGGYRVDVYADNLPVINEGDVMKVEFMLYVPSGQPDYGFYCGFVDIAEQRAVSMGIRSNGNVVTDDRTVGGWQPTGLNVTFDAWQKWEQEWTVGEVSKTISVGGNSVALQGADSGGNPLSLFLLSTVDGGHYYIDGVSASTPVAGDYNSNGFVDAADYTIWRDHLGQPFQLTNEGGISPGVVDGADYGFWKSRFGNSSGSGGQQILSASVPEPAAIGLSLMGLLWTIAPFRGQRVRKHFT